MQVSALTEAPHAPRRRACCPFHMVMGAFSPERAEATQASCQHPSFLDLTAKTPSPFCSSDRSWTEGLYELLNPRQALVFRNVRVLTMAQRQVIESHDVIVRDGMIERVQPTAGALPEDAIIVEGSGKTLLPGLSDIHAHPTIDSWARAFAPILKDGGNGRQFVVPYDLMLFQLLAAGVTRIEVMAGCPDTLWMRDQVRNNSLVGPHLSVGSPLIDGYPYIITPIMSYVLADREGGRAAAAEVAAMGFDFAKPYTNLSLEAYEGLADECHKRGIRMMGHVPASVGVKGAVERGQQGIAHAAELFYNDQGETRYSDDHRDHLVRIMADAGTWLQATVIVFDRMEWRGGRRALNAPDIEYMHPLGKKIYAEDSPFILMARQNPEKQYLYEDTFELSCRATRAAKDAGVRVLTGTDFANPYVVEGFSIHEEFEHLVNHCGFDPHEVLVASTRRAAEYHGEGSCNGQVVEGARADLILLDMDPLLDIRNTRSITAVLAQGRALLRRDKIDEGLARLKKCFGQMPTVEVALGALPRS